MDDERNNGSGAPENDFESQLAELIKQSGGTVPPKKKPAPAPETQEEPAAPKEKTAEEIDAEIEAMINSMSSGSRDETATDVPPFVMTDADFHATESEPAAGFTMSEGDAPIFDKGTPPTDFTVPEEAPSFVMPEQEPAQSEESIDDIMAEIERLERETANAEREKAEAERARLEEEEALRREMAQNEQVSAKLDDELEAMLESMSKQATEPPHVEEPEPATAETQEATEPEAPKATEAEQVKHDEPEKEQESKESETTELFKEPVEIVATNEEHEASAPIDVNRFDKVEPPKEEQKPLDIATMEAMLQELLGDDRAKKEEKEQAVVSEMEQMRAKIASLEYMLANVDKNKSETAKTEEKVSPAPTQTDTQKIIEQAAKATKSDDINSMFKQWFDLEMAAKMKNIITEDEKKTAAEKEKQSSYDKAPAVYNEPEQGSDFIKLSDNVYYNVREKKTYVMRELKPTVSVPKKKVVKKKIIHKAAPRPRRALHARPGMRPRRPRRPLGPPRRRRP